MALLRTLSRCAETAVKLPFAMAWDAISLGNMGDGASTSKVLREHQDRKQLDEYLEAFELLREFRKD